MNTISVLDKSRGLNNVLTDYEMEFNWLKTATNVDIDDNNKLSIRNGTDSVLSADVHSIWSNGEICLFRQTDTLKKLNIVTLSPLVVSSTTLVSGLSTKKFPMNYLDINGIVYFCDGINNGIIENGEYREWGSSIPLVTEIDVLEQPPVGSFLTYYNSRIFVIENNVVWYSEPNSFEYFNLSNNYLMFENPVTMFAPVESGIWAGTNEEIDFLRGDDVTSLKRIVRSTYGVASNNYQEIEGGSVGDGRITGKIIVFFSKNGACLGTSDGILINISESRFTFPDMGKSVSLLRRNSSSNQYIIVSQ
jgi:hypothetical protein